jgi:hypothetical protein
MAGDWIKIELTTPNKPEIDVLAELLNVGVNDVLGGLVRLWIWADQQTVDGNAHSVTKCAIDRHSGVTGLAEALLSPRVKWLIAHENGGFAFPNFERHNGQTAKRRALTAKRVSECKQRKGNAKVTPAALPREEKRREDISTKVDNSKSRKRFSGEDMECATWMLQTIQNDTDQNAKANLDDWANTIRLMREVDKRQISAIREVFAWAHQDPFWCPNILSPAKLRKQFTSLLAKKSSGNGQPHKKTSAEYVAEALRKSAEREKEWANAK